MKLIVGLGNPGEKYANTRHNLGFMVLDHLLKDIEPVKKTKWEENAKLKSEVFSLQNAILAKPKTYMNNSGMAVTLISSYYKISPDDIWVIHDELDLPLGSMKIRFGGSAAGHHGVNSIIGALGTDKFWRFRLGIGFSKHHDEIAKHKFRNTDAFVLDRFTSHEARIVKHLIKRGAEALKTALEKDIYSAMNRFNTK